MTIFGVFLSFLLCLVFQSSSSQVGLEPFSSKVKTTGRALKEGLSCLLLWPFCVGPLVVPAPSALSGRGLAPRHSPMSAHPGHLCHQYLAHIDGYQWLSGAGEHLVEFSSGFKDCFACSCSGHPSAGQQMWVGFFFLLKPRCSRA